MPKKKKNVPHNIQQWADVKTKYHLSQTHVEMARKLGLNPRKLGQIANHKQEPWKAPLPQFIEELYEKRFGIQS